MVDEESSHPEMNFPLSKERRKFIIVVAFDSVLITSLWILCTVKKGGPNWKEDFLAEVNLLDPQFLERSLFDLAILANLRAALLLFFYVVLHCQHWLPVALCTVGSTLYTVAKIFLFFGQRPNSSANALLNSSTQNILVNSSLNFSNFDHRSGGRHDGVPHYFLVLGSLFIAWFELWLMPFHVLNAERCLDGYAYQRHRSSPSAESVETDERRRMQRTNQPTQLRHVRSAVALTLSRNTSEYFRARNSYRTHTVSEDEFHSALEYSSGEDESPDVKEASRTLNTGIGQILRNESLQLAVAARNSAKAMLINAPTWRIIHNKTPIIRVDDASNTYYVNAEFRHAPRRVFDAIWWKSQNWNRNVREFRVLNKIDARTDVVLCTSSPTLGGYVAQRHFVDVRTYEYETDSDSFFGVYTSVEAKGRTSNEYEIWGKNGVNAMRVVPIPASDSPDKTGSRFEWLMNTDLQGAIPRVLVRRTMGTFLCDYVRSLEQFLRNTHAPDSL